MSDSAALLLLALPVLLAGAALALFARSSRVGAVAALLSQSLATALVWAALAPVVSGGAALEAHHPWPEPFGALTLRVDALSAFFLAWSLPMTLLGTLYATSYLRPYLERGRRGGPHYALLNLVSASFVLIYSMQNALVFLLGWEIAAVSAWLLVIWDHRDQRIRFAGFNYLVSTHLGLFVLVAAFMLLHARTDSMDFRAFGRYLASPSPTRDLVFVLLGVSFALKSAFFPFHTWLPRAHAAAPAHVSALMSGVIHKAGLFGFVRFALYLGTPEEWMGWSVLGFGLLSALFGALQTVPQRDLKRALGYSSTENVGIAAAGFGVGMLGATWGRPEVACLGFAGGLLHLLNHAFFKCLLFYAAGGIFRATHTVDLERLGGLARRLPRTAACFLLGALAICALPPLSGFVSEFLVFAGLLWGGAPDPLASVALACAAATLAFVGGVSALAMTRAFGVAFLGSPREPDAAVGEDAPAAMFYPMALHGLGVVALGLAPAAAFALIGPVLRLVPGAADPAVALERLAPVVTAGRVLAAALVGVGVWAWRRGLAARRSPTWGCGYTAGNPRMQYTGSGFSEHFARVFDTVLPAQRRERRAEGVFPRATGALATHHVDVVERRLFEVLGQGETLLADAAARLSEQPRFAFAAGFVALLVAGALLLGGGAP